MYTCVRLYTNTEDPTLCVSSFCASVLLLPFRGHPQNFFKYKQADLAEAQGSNKEPLTFPQFVRMVSLVFKTHRRALDPRLAPESDLCWWGSIHYDFVGRADEFDDQVKPVLKQRLGEHSLAVAGAIVEELIQPLDTEGMVQGYDAVSTVHVLL